MAIRRTTPALLGLFSLVTLFAHRRMTQAVGVFRQVSWYHKGHPTFADALAWVRKDFLGPGGDFLRVALGESTLSIQAA